MTAGAASASRRYKDILAELGTAAAEVRERDRARVALIDGALPGLNEEMLRTGERARLTGVIVALHWERAMDLLWAESWMKLRPRPAPDPGADPSRLEAYEAEVEQCADALARTARPGWYTLRR